MTYCGHRVSLINFPSRTGPLVNSWCMRMEAKNSICKQLAVVSNFKNVPYSVANRHQHLLCAYLQSDIFFDCELDCGPGTAMIIKIYVTHS